MAFFRPSAQGIQDVILFLGVWKFAPQEYNAACVVYPVHGKYSTAMKHPKVAVVTGLHTRNTRLYNMIAYSIATFRTRNIPNSAVAFTRCISGSNTINTAFRRKIS